jgi:hypothetical protein
MLLTIFINGGANATPLSNLLNGGSITAGDKLFDNWSLGFYDSSDGRTFNAANIDVTALNDGGLNPGPGLIFSVSNGELSVNGDGIYAFVDLMFGFRASVTDPAFLIKDNSLGSLNAFVASTADLNDGSNDNGNYINEKIGTAAGLSDLGINEVEFSILDSVTTSNVTDSVVFAPQREVWVTKNILVWAVDDTDSAGLYGFDQRFSQTPAVPEPSTFLLLGGGLAALVAIRRRTTKG